MMFRHITLQEANVFLPLVKERFARIHTLAYEGQALHAKLTSEKKKSKKRRLHVEASNLHCAAHISEANPKTSMADRLSQIEHSVRNEIEALKGCGILVRGLMPPRVEFLSKRHGRTVYLSWEGGDQKVSHWHLADEDFDHRRPIESPQAFGSSVIH